jgi:hypothetical protein
LTSFEGRGHRAVTGRRATCAEKRSIRSPRCQQDEEDACNDEHGDSGPPTRNLICWRPFSAVRISRRSWTSEDVIEATRSYYVIRPLN